MDSKESHEMYLETILLLREAGKKPRGAEIARQLHFSRASVSIAIKKLAEEGFVSLSDDNSITLSAKGEEIARRIFERHQILSEMLIDLGVEERVAREDACRMEHYISEESFQAIKNHRKEKK